MSSNEQNNGKVQKKLQQVFREVFDDDKLVINRNMTASDVEDWDSFAQINLVIGCEKIFRLHFDISEIVGLEKVGDMMDLIERKLSA
jgi:acyl carrier protein